MKTFTRLALFVTGLLLLFNNIITAHFQNPISQPQSYKIGEVVDNFTLPSATGDSISLYDYWGNVILIHIWHYA